MTTSESSAKSSALQDFSGLLVLVGAGKMGSALLEGWLRLGLNPKNLAVLEPEPTAQITALAGRGLRLNPDPHSLQDVTAVVIAVKPQVAAQVVPDLAPLITASTVVVSIMAGRKLELFGAGAQDQMRLGACNAEYPGRDRARYHGRSAARR